MTKKKKEEKRTYVTRKVGAVGYYLGTESKKKSGARQDENSVMPNKGPLPGEGLAKLDALVEDVQFLYCAVLFPVMFGLSVTKDSIAGAVFSRHTVCALVMSLHSYFNDRERLEFVTQEGSKVRFQGRSGECEKMEGKVSDVTRIVREVLTEVGKVFEQEMSRLKALAGTLRHHDSNNNFVKNLGYTFELTFKHHLRAVVLRLGISIGKEAAKRCNDSEGWHGVTDKMISGMAGLKAFSNGDGSLEDGGFDLNGQDNDDVDKINEAAHKAAKDACAIVLDVIESHAGLLKTDKGFRSGDVDKWLNGCTDRRENYHKLLEIVKELQRRWRLYKPNYRGVLLYPILRKAPMLRFPNCCFEEERGTADWPSFFTLYAQPLVRTDEKDKKCQVFDEGGKPMLRVPPFDKFRKGSEEFKGGIMTDGKTLYIYGERPVSKQQRTEERTKADLSKHKTKVKVKEQLNGPANLWVNNVKHTVKGKLESRVVRPYGEDNFTGIVTLEKLYEAMGRDCELLKGRVVVYFDLGEKYAVAGQIIFDGVRFHSFRFSARSLFQQTGRDEKERSGNRAREVVVEEFSDTDYLRQFERQVRTEPDKDGVSVDIARLVQELPAMMKQNRLRTNTRWKVLLKEDDCFDEILKYIVNCIEIAQKATKEATKKEATKKPFVVIGEQYGPSKCACGTRGHMATPLIKYLAQFLLIVKVPEHNTTKLCPLCHCETQFANDQQEIRSKVCRDCPVAGKDFFYDRDYGAASNIQYKAEFFVRSGGLYPAEFITIKQRLMREELFAELFDGVVKQGEPEEDALNLEMQAAVVDASDRDDANSASEVETQ